MRAHLLTISMVASFVAILLASSIANGVTVPAQDPTWRYPLPARQCEQSTSTHCHNASAVLADLSQDGHAEIIVATNNGYVVAVRHDGTLLWEIDLAPLFGVPPASQAVRASPAIGDIDGDGSLEVVVATHNIGDACQPGGVVVLDDGGQLKPGWPQLGDDLNGDGCPDGFAATPALGDLDQDGRLEIVTGGFDKRIRAWHDDGTPVAGFAVDSFHLQFRDWPILEGRLADTIWSSPALADLDLDGYLDIIIGSDEGFHESFGGWSCPYTLPDGWDPGYCGGSLYAVDRFGNHLPGFPIYIYETIQSSPAVTELDGDPFPEVVVGTGTFYHTRSPDAPTNGFRLFAFNHDGTPVAGWQAGSAAGLPVDHVVPSAPVVGDLDGDLDPEVAVMTYSGQLFAWHHDGTQVSGFPMLPVDRNGAHPGQPDLHAAIVMGDFDGDTQMEMFTKVGWDLVVIDGDGTQLTDDGTIGSQLPALMTNGSLLNTPAVGDLDGDGRLDAIATNSEITLWSLEGSSPATTWPLFRRATQRRGNGSSTVPLTASRDSMLFVHNLSAPQPLVRSLQFAAEGEPFVWQIDTPPGIEVMPTQGVSAGETVTVSITLDAADLPVGHIEIGRLMIWADVHAQTAHGVDIAALTGYFEHIHFLPAALKR